MKLVTEAHSLSPRHVLARDIGSTFGNAGSTLGSWDTCMSKSYCKWPVIVGIIIGGLILLSIFICIARCCCCGLECCCGCFRCCNACCPSPRKNKNKGYTSPQQPPPAYGQWGPSRGPQPWAQVPSYNAAPQQPQPYNTGMMSGALNNDSAKRAREPTAPNVARFESEKPLAPMEKPKPHRNPANEDQLPSMPTWGQASEHHVLDESYHPPAETPPGAESELAKATGQDGVLLQDRVQRKPTLPGVESGGAKGQGRPTLPTLDSSTTGATSNALQSSTALPASQTSLQSSNQGYGYGAGAAAGVAAGVAGAYGRRTRTPVSRQQPPATAYGASPPPRRPLPGHQQHLYTHGYPSQDDQRAVSPVSPITPHSGGGYGVTPAPSYRTRDNASAPPLPAYASRQGTQNGGYRSPPQNQRYGPPPTQTPPQNHGYGQPPRGTPPPNQYGGYSSPPPQPQMPPPLQIHSPPPPQQQQHQGYGGYTSPPARTPSAPRPAPPVQENSYQAYQPYNPTANRSGSAAGRAELAGNETSRELHGAGHSRAELGGGGAWGS